jgi:hypothetical protein
VSLGSNGLSLILVSRKQNKHKYYYKLVRVKLYCQKDINKSELLYGVNEGLENWMEVFPSLTSVVTFFYHLSKDTDTVI